ncbi:MAG: hypothetical protein HY834_12095 [Devosia nanyangense]|uniref:Uncharacterized protein n=1 Tax=Devosia nanyangense TaxID=1228055 RepID=A0A933L3N7_9HYPH|nr:hypothetical protein [Devosia nanyangense]
MADNGFDVALFGSTPLARLVAGILARDHGRRVLLIGREASPQRLPRTIDSALPAATRPETWSLLRAGELETLRLLGSIGAAEAVSRITVAVHGDTEATAVALAHIAHLAMGFGMAGRSTGPVHTFRDVALLNADALSPKLAPWLASLGVTAADSDAAQLGFLKSGAAELTVSGERVAAAQIVLADDPALLDLLPEAQRPEQLIVQPMTATLTAPTRRLPAPVVRWPARGITLLRRPGDSVLALIDGDTDTETRLASALPGPFPLARLATSRFRRVVTTDGAPLIGRLKPSKLTILAGLGDAAVFLAPAIARWLAGVSSDDEKRWFAARDPARPSRETVAEFVP